MARTYFKDFVLTDEERGFAEEHHGLVWRYIQFRRLNPEKYYDLAALGYCRAVCHYSRRPELHKWEFTTIAFSFMRSSISNWQSGFKRLKRDAVVLSLDAPLRDAQGKPFGEFISKSIDPVDMVCYAESLRESWDEVPESYREELRAVLGNDFFDGLGAR